MGKYIIAGNWKMNKLPSETYDYIKEVIDATKGSECEVVCCTPFVCLPQAVEAAKGSHVKIGAENLHFEDKGAFTGEVSAEMLKDLGVDYVIMGHSERREYNNETDETVNLKAKKALEKGLIPIVCCGESLEQREAGITMDWIAIQRRHLPESVLTTLRKLSLHTSQSGLSVQARLLLTTKLKKFAAVSENYLKTFTMLKQQRLLLFNTAAA